jgi:Ca2+-binding EF-hand superfamily protein
MKVLCFVVAMLVYGGAVDAQSATDGTDLARRFRQADRDGDGKLSEEEARASPWFTDEVKHFDGIDRDHNGTVTLAEIGEAIAGQVSEWLGADTDHDGRVSEGEAKANSRLREAFNRADADGDRVVTRDEAERMSERTYYRDAELPSVAPNIIEKRF